MELSGGFEAPGTGVLLDFSGTDLAGLEVVIDSVSLGTLSDIWEAYGTAREGADATANMVALATLCTRFAACLESWNVTRRGVPVPADYDGLMSLDHQFALKMIGLWISRTTSAGDDLGKDSTSGETSDRELLTQAAALSSSLPS